LRNRRAFQFTVSRRTMKLKIVYIMYGNALILF